MLDQAMYDYCGFDQFYDLFQPLTPYGQQSKKIGQFFDDEKALMREHELIEMFLNYHDSPQHEADLSAIKGCLARVTMLPLSFDGVLDPADIFLVKRFLFNLHKIYQELATQLADFFHMTSFPDELLALVSKGQPTGESFALADQYDIELVELRKKIEQTLAQQAASRRTLYDTIKQQTTLDFEGRELLIVPVDQLAVLTNYRHLLAMETYDEKHLLTKPLISQDIIASEATLWQLRREEGTIEHRVMVELSMQIKACEPQLRSWEDVVARLDVALAKAELAKHYSLIKPVIDNELFIEQGRLFALQEECVRQGRAYTPLDLAMTDKGALLYGSNMAGKSVVLKTIMFLQILTQQGFFVPAHEYRTRLYHSLALAGAGEKKTYQGLSSFGCEIWEFRQKWAARQPPCFFIIDEFASTTNPGEAIALNKALLQTLYKTSKVFFLMATHFIDDDSRLAPVKILQMAGLDHHKFKKILPELSACVQLAEKVRLLNNCLTYKIIERTKVEMTKEAINVATALGLDKGILKLAAEFLENGHEE